MCASGSGRAWTHESFVTAGLVGGGDRDVVCAEVDYDNHATVDGMVEQEAADDGVAQVSSAFCLVGSLFPAAC